MMGHQNEFVSPKPGDEIVSASHRVQPPCDNPQESITHLVSIQIIYLFKAVAVNEADDHRLRPTLARNAQTCPEKAFEGRSIGKPSEQILRGSARHRANPRIEAVHARGRNGTDQCCKERKGHKKVGRRHQGLPLVPLGKNPKPSKADTQQKSERSNQQECDPTPRSQLACTSSRNRTTGKNHGISRIPCQLIEFSSQKRLD